MGDTTTAGLLDRLIPESTYYVDEEGSPTYISRSFEGIVDLDLLRYAREGRYNTMLFGPTGPGKTSLIMAYAAKDRLPLVTIQCQGAVDPETFWGDKEWSPELGAYVYTYSAITEVIKHGGVLYLDEVNFLPAKVASVFHGLLDKRRQVVIQNNGNEVITAHENLQVIVAFNPDYEGTRPLNAAFKNRFRLKVEMNYDPEVEAQLLCLPAMQEVAAKLRISHAEGVVDTPCSTNMLVEFEETAVDLGFKFAVSNFTSAFAAEEREAVKEVFGLFGDRLQEQLREAIAAANA